MQRGFAQIFVVLFLLLLLIAVLAGLYFSSRNSETKAKFVTTSQSVKPDAGQDSKPAQRIYADNNLGVSFEYAKDLEVKQDSEEEFNKRGNTDFRKNFKGYVTYEPEKSLGALVVLDKTKTYDTNPLTIWLFDNPNGLSIDTWYKNYWYYPFVWGDFTYTGKFELAPKTEATVSGQLAKSGVIDYQNGKPKFIYVAKDKKMYLFRVIGENGDKIIQTLRLK